MKKIVMTLFGALLLAGCQNELYTESQKENGSGQGAYIAAEDRKSTRLNSSHRG